MLTTKVRPRSTIVAMSLLSLIIFITIIILTSVRADQKQHNLSATSVHSFKEYISNAIRNQSTKIQGLFEKIQSNSKIMLKKLNRVKSDDSASIKNMESQPSPPVGQLTVSGVIRPWKSRVRSYGSVHYPSAGYGLPNANSNHGAPSYHHHSIGFDPLNIVLSVSLLSFLLQAIQGLLSRTRLPTPVVEAKQFTEAQEWLKLYESQKGKALKSDKQSKKKYDTYYRKV